MAGNYLASRTLIIIGAGGHAVSVANVAIAAGISIKYFVDASRAGETLLDIPIIADIADLKNTSNHTYAIAIGHNAARERVHRQIVAVHGKLTFPTLIHPTAILSVHAQVGEGTVIMPNAVVGPNSIIGCLCILNTMSSIDHDCEMSNYSSLAPGAMTGGEVTIGERSAISIGATVKNAVSIGHDSVVGGKSYVNKCIGSNLIAYGSPARPIRSRERDDPYLA